MDLSWTPGHPRPSIAVTFQTTLPGVSFVVNGAAQAAGSTLTTAPVRDKMVQRLVGGRTFEGEFSDVTSSYAGMGAVRYRWWASFSERSAAI